MKYIQYQIMTEVNAGTPEVPDIRKIFSQASVPYSEKNLEDVMKEAYNGEYQIIDVPDTRPLHEIKADKETELSAACNSAITAGMDVVTSQGTERFSLQETDQINLTTALSAVQAGAAGYPYHADGKLCRMFTAEEIQAIAAASVQHKLYHTTLCNHLLTWARRAETAEELEGITYTAEGMPEDLAANMAAVLSAAMVPAAVESDV